MWVRSQDKTSLTNCITFSIQKVFGGKGRMAVLGYNASMNGLNTGAVQLGCYDSTEEAIEVLDNIQAALISNPNQIYEMK